MISAEQMYAEFYPKVSAYVRGKVSNCHDAEEIVSAVFLKAVQKLDSYDPTRASLSTWVYTITRNTVTDFFRTHRTMAALEEYMAGEEAADLSDDALDTLADALLTLKEKERDLIVLHYYKGHTLKEAGGCDGHVLHQRQGAPQKGFDRTAGILRSWIRMD